MWTIFKVFTRLVTVLLLFYISVFWLVGMWGVSSPTRDRISTPALEGKVLTTRPPAKSPTSLSRGCFQNVQSSRGLVRYQGPIPSRWWQPTPVFLPGEFHGQRSLAGYSPQDHRVGHDWVTTLPTWISSPSQTTLASALVHPSSGRSVKGKLASHLPPPKDNRTQEPCKHWHRTQLFQLQSRYLILSS